MMVLPGSVLETPTRSTGFISPRVLGADMQVRPQTSTPFLPASGDGYNPVPVVESSQNAIVGLGTMGWVLLAAGVVGIWYFLRKAHKG